MSLMSPPPTPPACPPLLERLFDKVASLENQVKELHDLLANRRKEHFVVEEVAEMTGRSAYTIRRWIAEQKLQAIRLRDGGPRGKLLIPRSELERLVASGRGAQVPNAIIG